MQFYELLYNDRVLDALDAMNFSQCTPIQEKAIPVAEDGHDLIAIAQTGTGKTAAYLLPVIDRLADGGYPNDAINCVVMAPTRELVQQIDQQMQGFSYFLPINSLTIYGGTDGPVFEQQKRGLIQGADVVIATPGRLLAHIQMGYVDLSKVSFFILDEADRMLDMGFFEDIMQVVKELPKERQTLLFSATMPPKIKELARQILYKPVEVKIAVSKPAERIDQKIYFVSETRKEDLLLRLFTEVPSERVLIFASSKLSVKQLARALRAKGIPIAEMHSDLDQAMRERVMLDFKSGKTKVLVATDIVSRGIDIDDIAMVINYDMPHEPEDYIHRIGRTARAEQDGKAITFVTEREIHILDRIERLIEKPVPRGEYPEGWVPDKMPEKGSKPRKSNKRPKNKKRHKPDKPASGKPNIPVAGKQNTAAGKHGTPAPAKHNNPASGKHENHAHGKRNTASNQQRKPKA
ncbi:MAG: DEAD/DEAH box helicase [Muribaculaceae bacterium]|nr:DEAD/DEAH box helicase [Muribaculaceae bacterium]